MEFDAKVCPLLTIAQQSGAPAPCIGDRCALCRVVPLAGDRLACICVFNDIAGKLGRIAGG